MLLKTSWLADYLLIIGCQIQSNVLQTNSRKKNTVLPIFLLKIIRTLLQSIKKKKRDAKSVQAAAIFWPRALQNLRFYFPIIKLSLFLIQSLWCLRSRNKSFFKEKTQLDGCLLFVEERKTIATLICTRKNYLLLLTAKKKDFSEKKSYFNQKKTTAQCVYLDIFGGKKYLLPIPVTKTIFNLDAILSQELFFQKLCILHYMYLYEVKTLNCCSNFPLMEFRPVCSI